MATCETCKFGYYLGDHNVACMRYPPTPDPSPYAEELRIAAASHERGG